MINMSQIMPLISMIRGGGNPEPMLRQTFGDSQVAQVSQLVRETPENQRGVLVQQVCQQRGIDPSYARQIAQMLGVSF